MEVIDYNKYENFIRVGQTAEEISNHVYNCTDLSDFPTPSTLSITLSDVDKDPFTDLEGYTHRNRVRHDVISSLDISYNVLSDTDLAYILNRISPEWIYIELKDKKTKERTIHKMYASDKKTDTMKIYKDSNDNWQTINIALTLSFVEE